MKQQTKRGIFISLITFSLIVLCGIVLYFNETIKMGEEIVICLDKDDNEIDCPVCEYKHYYELDYNGDYVYTKEWQCKVIEE